MQEVSSDPFAQHVPSLKAPFCFGQPTSAGKDTVASQSRGVARARQVLLAVLIVGIFFFLMMPKKKILPILIGSVFSQAA